VFSADVYVSLARLPLEYKITVIILWTMHNNSDITIHIYKLMASRILSFVPFRGFISTISLAVDLKEN